MSFWENDLKGMFGDMGETVDIDGFSIEGIFQEPFEAVQVYGLEADAQEPVFVCASADIPFVKVDSVLERKSTTYYVVSVQPDGMGATTLLLSKDN